MALLQLASRLVTLTEPRPVAHRNRIWPETQSPLERLVSPTVTSLKMQGLPGGSHSIGQQDALAGVRGGSRPPVCKAYNSRSYAPYVLNHQGHDSAKSLSRGRCATEDVKQGCSGRGQPVPDKTRRDRTHSHRGRRRPEIHQARNARCRSRGIPETPACQDGLGKTCSGRPR